MLVGSTLHNDGGLACILWLTNPHNLDLVRSTPNPTQKYGTADQIFEGKYEKSEKPQNLPDLRPGGARKPPPYARGVESSKIDVCWIHGSERENQEPKRSNLRRALSGF